jgi:hypothetical protein
MHLQSARYISTYIDRIVGTVTLKMLVLHLIDIVMRYMRNISGVVCRSMATISMIL